MLGPITIGLPTRNEIPRSVAKRNRSHYIPSYLEANTYTDMPVRGKDRIV